jgi:hypothetical protein
VSQDSVEYAVGGVFGFLFCTDKRLSVLFFLILQNAMTSIRGPPSLLLSGYHGFFPPGLKQQTCEDYHSSPSGAKVRNVWGSICTPFLCLHGVHRDSIIFYLIPNMIDHHDFSCAFFLSGSITFSLYFVLKKKM